MKEIIPEKDAMKGVNFLVESLYKDVAKPSMEKMGIALGNVFGLLQTLTLPVQFVNEASLKILRRNLVLVGNKLDAIDKNDIAPPIPELAKPILERLEYTSNDELVEIFSNLLIRACRKSECSYAHPTFVNWASSLAPDEARILSHYKGGTIYSVHPAIRFNTKVEHYELLNQTTTYCDEVTEKSQIYTGIEHKVKLLFPENLEFYLDNLRNLGILDYPGYKDPRDAEIKEFHWLKKKYDKKIEAFYELHQDILGNAAISPKKELMFRISEFTTLGRMFIKAACQPVMPTMGARK